MAAGGAGRDRALRDERRGVGDQRRDVTEHKAHQVGTVRGQIAEHSVAAVLARIAPTERPVRVCGVVTEQPDPSMRRSTDATVGDDLARGLYRRRVPVVEPHRSLPVRGCRRSGDGLRVGRGQADRLLDPQVLSRCEDCGPDLRVQKVRHGHRDRVDVRIGEDLAPVAVGLLRPVLPGALRSTPRDVVGDGDQPREQRRIGIVLPEPGVRARMDRAHPAHADDGDAEGSLFCHEEWLSGREGRRHASGCQSHP